LFDDNRHNNGQVAEGYFLNKKKKCIPIFDLFLNESREYNSIPKEFTNDYQ